MDPDLYRKFKTFVQKLDDNYDYDFGVETLTILVTNVSKTCKSLKVLDNIRKSGMNGIDVEFFMQHILCEIFNIINRKSLRCHKLFPGITECMEGDFPIIFNNPWLTKKAIKYCHTMTFYIINHKPKCQYLL